MASSSWPSCLNNLSTQTHLFVIIKFEGVRSTNLAILVKAELTRQLSVADGNGQRRLAMSNPGAHLQHCVVSSVLSVIPIAANALMRTSLQIALPDMMPWRAYVYSQ